MKRSALLSWTMTMVISVLVMITYGWGTCRAAPAGNADNAEKSQAAPVEEGKTAAEKSSDATANPADSSSSSAQSAEMKPAPGRDAPLWDPGKEEAGQKMPMVRKLNDGMLLLGNIAIDKRRGSVIVKGEVNMPEGLVEYLACGPRGKLHESVLKLDVDPYSFQIALLLIGMEPGGRPLKSQGDPARPEGDEAQIWVTWESPEKKMVKHRAEDLVLNKTSGKPMEHCNWVFAGSQVVNGRFMAAVEHSVVAIYHDPFAILDNPLASGGDDRVHFANKEVVPPKGTPITLIVQPVKSEAMPLGPRPGMRPERPENMPPRPQP